MRVRVVTEIRVTGTHIRASLSPLFVAQRAWHYGRRLVDAVWEEMFIGFMVVAFFVLPSSSH